MSERIIKFDFVLRITTLFLLLSVYSLVAFANDNSKCDSIMHLVTQAAERYNNVTESYEAEVYMKTNVTTKKKNFLYQYTNLIPDFVISDPKNDEAFIESFSLLKFESPTSYSQDIKYINGTLTKKKDIALLPFRFISMDIYNESNHGESFYLPLRKSTSKYYDYHILFESEDDIGHRKYIISFTPKYVNPQLIAGSFTVEEGNWRVLNFQAKGSDLFFDFSFFITMGNSAINMFFPERFDIQETYKYLGNEVVNRYQADLTYTDLVLKDTITHTINYNLGNVYRVRLDSVPVSTNPALWEEIRTAPLTEKETELLHKKQIEQREKLSLKNLNDKLADTKNKKNSVNTTKLMLNVVSNTRYQYKSGDFQFSGLLNPLMMGYSTRDGIVYKQRAKLHINLPRQQRINFNFYGSYIFGHKQLNYGMKTTWNYEPFKLGNLSFDMGRGNPTYSSRFLHYINDSLYHPSVENKLYFRDYYFKLNNSVELANGLQLGAGIDYHIRQPGKDIDKLPIPSDLSNELYTQYDFVPLLSLTWTPQQYYVIDRNQKTYVRSDYPTFKIEFAQSIAGVMGSKSSYNRIEFDVNQRIRLGMLSNLNLHIGAGMFSNQTDEYFNDFSYFARRYFPENWSDGMGGSFNVLSRRYFNASDKYVQAHFMYDSSKLLLNNIPQLSRLVKIERLYLSQVYTPFLNSYTEVGYGLGNKYVNAALFFGFKGVQYHNIAAKAVFLL